MASSSPVTHPTLRQQGGTGEDGHIDPADWTLSVAAIERKKIVRDTVCHHATVVASFPFSHSSLELAQLTVTSPQLAHFFCLYKPPPSKENRLTRSAFFSEFCDFLEHCSLLGTNSFHFIYSASF